MSSQRPLVTTNPYKTSPGILFNFYWAGVLRRYWYIAVIIGGLVVFNIVTAMISNPFPMNIVFPLVPVLLVVFVRYRFLSGLKKQQQMRPMVVVAAYEDRLETTADSGATGVFTFDEMAGLRTAKGVYVIQLTNGNFLYVMSSAFKTKEDEVLFGQTIGGVLDGR